jgi:hypothetical protein
MTLATAHNFAVYVRFGKISPGERYGLISVAIPAGALSAPHTPA